MNAVIYARYSSDNQREESIDAQIRAIQAFAEHQDMSVIKIYVDEAKSATTDQRPEFLKMMKDAEAELFQAVIVHKLDRFCRDRYDSAFYRRHLKKHGARLYSVLENLDDSPESIILESVLEGMAEYFSKNLAREVMKGHMENADKCMHNGGTPPLGYNVDTELKYIINDSEAATVRLIFEMYAAGSGYNGIIDRLNEGGHLTKAGNKFRKNSLHDLLVNEKYAGVYVFNRSSKKSGGKRNNHKTKAVEEVIRVPGGMPAIVSDDLWERVNLKMKKNKNLAGRFSAKKAYLLTGKVYCRKCGAAMTGKNSNAGRGKINYSYYECSARKSMRTCDMKAINRDIIEPMVINTLYDSIFAPSVINKAADDIYFAANTNNTDISHVIKEFEKKLQNIEKEIDNLVNAIARGMFHPSMKEKLDELEAAKEAYSIRISEAKLQQKAHSLNRDQIFLFLKKYQDIKNMPPNEQRSVVELFVDRITVNNDDLNIELATTLIENLNKGRKITASDLATGNDSCISSNNICTSMVEINDNHPWFNNSFRITVSIKKYRHKNPKI